MLYTFPDYYEKFSCIGGSCEATCCAGWQIVVDDRSLKKYYNYDGNFKKKLRWGINWRQKCYRQDMRKRCAFLNKDNLCDMQLNLGEKNLCKICREYPRHIEEFENVREISLSVSCPVVAKLLLSKKDKTYFVDKTTKKEESFEDFDLLFYSMLVDARRDLIGILQNRDLDIFLRMALAIGVGHDLQGRINRADYFSFEDVLKKYARDKIQKKVSAGLKKYTHNRELRYYRNYSIFTDLYKLEHLVEGYDKYLRKIEECLYLDGADAYYDREEDFATWCISNLPDYEVMLEQLLVYFIFTYFCGSVYDGNVYGKVYMSVISVFAINEMIRAKWIMNARKISFAEIVKIVYNYSRELEHSDLNLDAFERFAKAFTM